MKKRYTVNFARHLSNCEFNYRRMCLLMPGWCHYPENNLGDEKITNESIENLNSSNQSTDKEPLEWHYLTGNDGRWQNAVMLQVVEIAKYTTTVHISVDSELQKQLGWFKTKKGSATGAIKKAATLKQLDAAYNLDVRLYHDAHLAEVISFANQRRFLPRNEYPNRNMHQQDEKAQLNSFLGEILDNCLHQGRVKHGIEFSAL